MSHRGGDGATDTGQGAGLADGGVEWYRLGPGGAVGRPPRAAARDGTAPGTTGSTDDSPTRNFTKE